MAALTIALRFAHFAAVIALAGGFGFLLWVARPVHRESALQPAAAWFDLRDRLMRPAQWGLALVLVSGVLWFFAQAATVSGASSARALDGETLAAVLTETLFGHVWIARLALAMALGAALFFMRRAPHRGGTMLEICAALAIGLLASLAWTGHAAAEQGADRVVHLSADVVHLLAAGAWLGALPGLAFVLARARRAADAAELEFAAAVTRRFSIIGIASVGALVLTGLVNAWYTLGSMPALFGTEYGWLLSAKLVLFAAMVALAAINRRRWTPRISQGQGEPAQWALGRLRRNAIAETALGLGALGIVGALGVAVPALHVQTFWPFPRTLDWNAVVVSPFTLILAVATTLTAGTIVAFGLRNRRGEMIAAGIALAAGTVATSAWLFAVPAHPTTYFQSPARYDVASVARGAPLYAEHCAGCHGPYGHGDGPAAASLPVRPPYLTARLARNREGDLLWSLERGVGKAMPGVGDRLGEDQLWDVLNFLRAQANMEAARRLDPSVDIWRPVTAPDFTFQIGKGAQESLGQERGRSIVLLVFYSLPRSLARLRELADSKARFDRLGLRVIAVPMRDRDAVPRNARGVDAGMLAGPDADLVSVYAMFTRAITDVGFEEPAVAQHVEFLIDRQGYMRSRSMSGWIPVPGVRRQAMLLNREKARPPAPERHVHER